MTQHTQKKVLVTGSNGLLGQKIIDLALTQAHINLTAISRGANRHPVKTGYQYESVDMTDSSALESVISIYQPDVIIHTAAMTNVDACEADPTGCHQLNVKTVETLTTCCEARDIHLIHLSTDFIFDGKNGPYKEEDTPNPLSVYGTSKLDSELILQQSSCKWTILRTILVYGVTTDMSRSNIVLWAKNTLSANKPLNIVNDQWRMPTLAEDLAWACMRAAERGIEGLFHISGKDMLSIYELVTAVADFWQLDKSLVHQITSDSLKQTAPRPKRTGFILDKAIKLLGYTPHSFNEGLHIVDEQLKKNKV